MRDLILVAAGGAMGAAARHLVSRAVVSAATDGFPWGTFLINISGCFLMGLVAGFANTGSLSPSTRLFVATGILGGYTTFSAFGLEAHTLLAAGRNLAALGYGLGQVVFGVLGIVLGKAVARRLG